MGQGLTDSRASHALATRFLPQATVLCDLLLLHILPKRHYYKQKKFKYAEDMGPEAVRDPRVRPFRGLGP